MTGFLKYEEKENEFKNYIGKYVEINLLPMGQTFYGKLKSFDKRVAILNPHKGHKLINGKLENALISDSKYLYKQNWQRGYRRILQERKFAIERTRKTIYFKE